MIRLENINVWFGNHHVLKNIDCEIKRGDFIIVVGTNGAGKSTFFDIIAGKIKPTSGRIIIDNHDVTHLNETQRAPIIARIFQDTNLNSVGSFTVEQNLAIARYNRRYARLVNGMKAMPQSHAQKIMHDLDMDPAILKQTMNSLSGGQRQLIAFAMATQAIPKVLLLDEPTAALDPQASTILLKHAHIFIKKHRVTTLLITHDPYIAMSLGNKVWILEQGTIAKQFNEDEKRGLHPEQLIGQIDYSQLNV